VNLFSAFSQLNSFFFFLLFFPPGLISPDRSFLFLYSFGPIYPSCQKFRMRSPYSPGDVSRKRCYLIVALPTLPFRPTPFFFFVCFWLFSLSVIASLFFFCGCGPFLGGVFFPAPTYFILLFLLAPFRPDRIPPRLFFSLFLLVRPPAVEPIFSQPPRALGGPPLRVMCQSFWFFFVGVPAVFNSHRGSSTAPQPTPWL